MDNRQVQFGAGKSTRGIAVAAAALVASTALAACGEPGNKVADSCTEATGFTYGFPGLSPTVGSAAKLSVGTEAGYYGDECLKVKVEFIEGSTPTIQTLERGRVDAASPFSSSVYQGNEAGADVKGFYAEINSNNVQPQVLEDSDIRTAKDLIGKTVGLSALESGSKLVVDQYIAAAGGDPAKDVKYVAVGLGAAAADFLTSGKVDAIAIYDGAHAQLKAQPIGLPLRAITDPKVDGTGVGFWLPLVARTESLTKDRDTLARFGRAFAKSYLFTETNPECAVKLHWQAYPDSKPAGVAGDDAMADALLVLKARMDFAKPPAEGYGHVTDEQVAGQAKLLKTIKAIDREPSVDDVWDPGLLDEINDFDHDQVVKDAKSCRGLEK